MRIAEFNQLDWGQAVATLTRCCAATRWVDAMVKARPYADSDAILANADMVWESMQNSDLFEAFAAHPKIGDVSSLREKYHNTKALAAGEQALVDQAEEQVLLALAEANEQYINQYGFIFIVCATGKSAQQMLDLLLLRLNNTRQQELVNAAEEQRKITAIRINKLFD